MKKTYLCPHGIYSLEGEADIKPIITQAILKIIIVMSVMKEVH